MIGAACLGFVIHSLFSATLLKCCVRKISFISLILVLAPAFLAGSFVYAAPKLLVEHRERASEPNFERTAPIQDTSTPNKANTTTTAQPATTFQTATVAPQTTQTTLGPNLVKNPSLENAGTSAGLPANWRKGGYGNNTRTLAYPVAGTGGSTSKAISLTVSNYVDGDAKWYPDEMPVTAGSTYQFSDSYKGTATSIAEIRFTLSNGTFAYKTVATLAPASVFANVSGQVVAPAGAVSATIFHLIKSNGTLIADDFSFNKVTVTQSSSNYIQNGDFETAGSGGLPLHWSKGGYGTNTRTFTYPVTGQSGNGAKITISGYSSGDAKWVSDPVSIPSGAYSYSDAYTSSVPSILTAEFARSDGSLFYADLGSVPASASWGTAHANFTMPVDAVSVRIFHLIKANGTLTIDNTSITSSQTSSTGIFATGAVTFRFDDGLKEQYTNAAPILDAAGFKGEFYIITHQIFDNGYTGYMSKTQVQDLFARGHEIGAHTQTHPHLTTLSAAQQQQEISGSRQDLLGWNVGAVLSFSYPFGEYDSSTIQIVKDAGFSSAVATISGYVTPSSDHYQLEYQELKSDTTLAQVQAWVNTAAQNHQWLILTFHNVKTGGDAYDITPALFQNIVTYVKQKGLPVVTVGQGMDSM